MFLFSLVCYTLTYFCRYVMMLGVGDTGNFGIDRIPSNYRASIADIDIDTNTDTFS